MGGQLFDKGLAVVKKTVITGAQIVHPGSAAGYADKPVPGAFAVTHNAHLTGQAFARQMVKLGPAKGVLRRTVQ